jgi:hypothetical protein
MSELLSLLTFPQRLKDGMIEFNILVIPRNISPLQPLKAGQPSFADAKLKFKAQIVDSLDDLPQISAAINPPPALQNVSGSKLNLNDFYNNLKIQFQASENITITDATPAQKAVKFSKNIRKYLPESYRSAFNFTNPRTAFASIDDAYHCAVKNVKAPPPPPPVTDIPWGKAIAYCLRNPVVAKQAGLIYSASVKADSLYNKGGWLFVWFSGEGDYSTLDPELDVRLYAARIPSLKDLTERILFAPVHFRVSASVTGDGLDQVSEEAITYNDGFAHIVHANQPVNQYYLEEKDASNPPSKDTGIRLGWDDEQILIWHNRQASQTDEISGLSIDAPLGVFGYRVDVKDKTTVTDWVSLNAVTAKTDLVLNTLKIADAATKLETGIEVTPTQLESGISDYWLPMYYNAWLGRSLVLTDEDAVEIFKHKDAAANPDPSVPAVADSAFRKAKNIQSPYAPAGLETIRLLYGHEYDFRVRFMDITGGGPLSTDERVLPAQAPAGNCKFKRCVTAQSLRIKEEGTGNTPGQNFSIDKNMTLSFLRPLLGYPAVVFTGKYIDPIKDLKDLANSSVAAGERFQPALPDPDVNRFNVLVEVRSLYMDNQLSATGRESYIRLYEKEFTFPTGDFYADKKVRIKFNDVRQVNLDGSGIDHQFDGADDELLLPSARNLRLTFSPIVSDTDDIYASSFVQYGKKIAIPATSASGVETALFENPTAFLKGIYLQPEDEDNVPSPDAFKLNLKGNILQNADALIQRVADELHLGAKQLSLMGQTGQRLQFGCSRNIRHSLSPDYTSVTFSSKKELLNHWLMIIDLQLNRDWAWNALQTESILIERKIETGENILVDFEQVGHIKLSNTINIQALTEPVRSTARLLFFDAFDPKEVLKKFPREATLSYRITPVFAPNFGQVHEGDISDKITLPVTINPVQMPKIASAGIAQTDYKFDEKYATTGLRQRFLWLEFEEPVTDKDNLYYCRVLAYAADPLIRAFPLNNIVSAVAATDEPALPLSKESIRVIVPGMSNDFAGAAAMQEMIPSSSSDKHFLLPLPPGLHGDSAELFGFFTYEIRVGHSKKIWSTAQGRFGRPLRATGVQHPCPALTCITSRSKKISGVITINEITVMAPYAKAVQDGKNVTASPPHTSLWCLLYAQVKQADDAMWRNILLDTREMRMFVTDPDEVKKIIQNKDGQAFGNCVFTTDEIRALLQNMGLPTTSSLSVLCVEMLPLNGQWRFTSGQEKFNRESASIMGDNREVNFEAMAATPDINPLREGLGYFRILRTSPLYKIADVCCEDC